MALLAYEEPEKSPMFHLLSPEYRQNVADCLNRAILGMLIVYPASFLFAKVTWYFIHLLLIRACKSTLILFLSLISAHANLPSYSSMERLIQQATVVRQLLHEEVGMVNIYNLVLVLA